MNKIDEIKERLADKYIFTRPGSVVVDPYTDIRHLLAERERLMAVVEADAKLITQLQKFKCGLTSHAGADELKKRERRLNECGRTRKEALAALEKEKA